MRILMLLENEYFIDFRVKKEVETLIRAGNEVIIAAITTSDLPYEEKKDDCIIYRKKISGFHTKSSVGALKVPVYFNFWRRYISNVLKSHKIDIIHIHDLPLAKIGLEVKSQYKVKVVLDLHENWPAFLSVSSHTNTFPGRLLSSEKKWRAYEKRCALNADGIIAVVDEMKMRISKLGIPPEKIYVVENTPDRRAIAEVGHETDINYFTLLYIGGISYHRGLQFVLSGIKLLIPEIPLRLWIAGDGKYAAALRDQADDLKIRNYINFLGVVKKSQIDQLMKKADLGLIPHIRSEQSDNSSPNKLFDYMASGLPVLSGDCTSVKRVIDETGSGKTYVSDSPSDFASVVRELYLHREKLSLYSLNGKNAIEEKYNWDRSAKSLLQLYSDLK